ncbi:MAG: hypothetical protein AAF409_19450 [Pseudomonadota bacterium]
MSAGYAVLGWGSLIWDLDDLAPKVSLPWHMRSGPHLPMEFTRISPKRKMGLAVCLDLDHGVDCPTHAIASRRSSLSEVISDLAARERAPLEMIGGVCLTTGERQGREGIAAIVAEWCGDAGWAGAVWTDLQSNYAEMSGHPFSVAAAIAYLKTLDGESLEEAVRYLALAPAETRTPLRDQLAQDRWWIEQVDRLLPSSEC